jgi:hypothetical protein
VWAPTVSLARSCCTCSTLGGSAQRVAQEIETRVVRIDRPMAESAVANGGRVALVVAIDSTLAPTRELFEQCAANAGSDVTLVDAPCLDAWERFEAGDHAGYLDRVARHVRGLADDVDVERRGRSDDARRSPFVLVGPGQLRR